jgi:uncharacterized protein YegP (UPF0339 family)
MRRFEAYEDENGRWRWRLWNDEGKIVACSGEAYGSQFEALLAADAVRAAAGGAPLAGEPGLGIAAACRLRALLSDSVPVRAAPAEAAPAVAAAADTPPPPAAAEVRPGERPRLRAVPERRAASQSGARSRLRAARR